MAYNNPMALDVAESILNSASSAASFNIQDAERLAKIQQATKARAIDLLKKEVAWTLRLSEGKVDKDVLIEASNEISEILYKDIVDERHLGNICGWPLCDKEPAAFYDPSPLPVLRFSPNGDQIYNIKARMPFCALGCAKQSEWYRKSLQERTGRPIFLEPETLAMEQTTDQIQSDSDAFPDLAIVERPLKETSKIEPEPPDKNDGDFERPSLASTPASHRFILGGKPKRKVSQPTGQLKPTTSLLTALNVNDEALANADLAKEDALSPDLEEIMAIAMQLRKDLNI